MKNQLLNTVAVILVLAGLGLLYYAFKGSKQPNPTATISLKASLESSLGANPSNEERIHINPDRQNPGKEYIASVQAISGLKKEEALKRIESYLKTAYIQIIEEELSQITSVSITLYDPSTTNQYRVILGADIGKTKNLKFWKESSSTEIFSWLKNECPKTYAENFTNFCTISKSIH